jgi:DNA-binding transcriptional MerR regulator/predicted transcriptional regulator YdeE
MEREKMYSIGEFSKITNLTIKALRLYHEKGILVPGKVDEFSNYRYYDAANVDKARIIVYLREMDFTLAEIKEFLETYDDEAELVEALETQKRKISENLRQYQHIIQTLDAIIRKEKEAKMIIENQSFEVKEKHVGDMLIAGIRFKGKYGDVGSKFGLLCRKMGRYASGNVMTLYYDSEYKEDNADIEAGIPVKAKKSSEGIDVHELPGGKCLSLIYQGPYEEISRGYERIMAAMNERGYKIKLPLREIYLKGPGMILKGNPKKYLTEIQLMIDDN